MDDASVLDLQIRALRADNERQRALTIEAHERALQFAKRCDALEVEHRLCTSKRHRPRLWWKRKT